MANDKRLPGPILERIHETFLEPGSARYQAFDEIAAPEVILGDHFIHMKDHLAGVTCKIEQSLYLGKLIRSPGGRVLDLGSGCGFFACVMAASGADSVIAVEPHQPFVRVARFLAEEVFQVENIEFVPTIEDVPPESVNAVTLINSISHVWQPLRMLLNLVQILKPHGLLLIEDNNNLESFLCRRKLKKTTWPGDRWDGDFRYRPMRVKRIRELGPGLADRQVEALADETYGMVYPEIERFVRHRLDTETAPFDTAYLKNRAPANPEVVMYHENAFTVKELEMLLFNAGLTPILSTPKYVFDFKRNPLVSTIFKTFPKLSLKVSPGYEVLAAKR